MHPPFLAGNNRGIGITGQFFICRHGIRAGYQQQRAERKRIVRFINSGSAKAQAGAHEPARQTFAWPQAAGPLQARVAATPILDIQDLHLQRGDTPILDGLNWRIERGEHWAVLGPNGCGKTTLLAALTGYKFPTRGDIQILGNTFGDSDWTELRKHIGLVSSTLNKLMAEDEPVLETIVSGKYAMIDLWHEPSAADKREARAILKRIECAHLADRPWSQLSQGERQRAHRSGPHGPTQATDAR